MDRFDEHKRKYQPVLNLIRQKGVRLSRLEVKDDKLFLQGLCHSQEIKDAVWRQVRLVDPSFRDLTCDLWVEESLSPPSPEIRSEKIKTGDQQ